jgi:FtsZ-binding cell division protein ZapB
MRSLYSMTLMLLIALSLMLGLSAAQAQISSGKGSRILVILAPGFDPTLNLSYTKTLNSILNHSATLRVVDSAPFSPIYHQLLLVNVSWDLGKAISVNGKVELPNGTLIEPYDCISRDELSYVWGQLDTMFILFSPISPAEHPRAINPAYNISGSIIPPTMITTRLNETVNWSLLNTTIRITPIEGGYRLLIKNYVDMKVYNTSMSIDNILINITGRNQPLNPGTYYLSIRLIRGANDTIIFFTPGTIKSSGWMSTFFGDFKEPFVAHIPGKYLKALDLNDIKWLFDQIQTTYSDIVDRAFKYRNAIVNMIYFPLYEEALKTIHDYNITGKKSALILNETMKALSAIIETARTRLGDTSMPIVIYSPYTVVGETTPEKNMIAPGLYNITDNITSFITTHKSSRIFRFGNSIMAVDYNSTVTGYGHGYLLLYKPGLNATSPNITVTPQTIAPYIASFAKGYGIGFKDLLEEISEKNTEISQLKSKISKLNSNITLLTQEVKKLKEEKGLLQSTINNQTIKIDELQKKVNDAETLKEQAYEYLVAGVTSIIVVIIILHVLLRIAVSKRPIMVSKKTKSGIKR